MPFIIINKDDKEEMRQQMRQQMRGNGGMRRMNMRDHNEEVEQAYKEGYTHGWKDHEREIENESMIEERRRRSSNGRFS